jgi:hypothetical protein
MNDFYYRNASARHGNAISRHGNTTFRHCERSAAIHRRTSRPSQKNIPSARKHGLPRFARSDEGNGLAMTRKLFSRLYLT